MPTHALPDGAAIDYERREGEGAPFVLLHGILDDRTVWDQVMHHLIVSGRSVLVMDARGHGASEPWSAGMDWSPRAQAEDAIALLRGVGLERAHLVGHSRGATAASWVAVEEPELAASLTVVASPPQASEVFRAWFRKQVGRDERERSAFEFLGAIAEDEFPTFALRRYRGPALVVEFEDDPLYSPTSTLFWRAFLPFAAFERVPGGHRHFATEAGARWLAERLVEL